MKLNIVLILALFFWALVTHGTDTNIDITLSLIEPSYETFILNEEKFEHMILALRRCQLFDEGLLKMASAARGKERKFFSLFSEDPATYICLPIAFSALFEMSGFMLGGINNQTPDTLIAIKAVSAFCVWFVGVLLYLNIPTKHKRDLEMRDQNLLDKDAIIKRLNTIVVKDNKVLNISRVIEGYEIKVHSSLINSLEKLDIFPFIFKTFGRQVQ